MYKKSNSFIINLSSIVGFSKQLRLGVAYKAENWSYEQYFITPFFRYLSMCL